MSLMIYLSGKTDLHKKFCSQISLGTLHKLRKYFSILSVLKIPAKKQLFHTFPYFHESFLIQNVLTSLSL